MRLLPIPRAAAGSAQPGDDVLIAGERACLREGWDVRRGQVVEIVLAIDLAKSCRFSRSTEAFHDEVRQLPFRGLDD